MGLRRTTWDTLPYVVVLRERKRFLRDIDCGVAVAKRTLYVGSSGRRGCVKAFSVYMRQRYIRRVTIP
jgi:hypothetical protein